MELTREYVESISFEIAKQKYYNSHKVDAVMDELRPAVLALIEENGRLRAQIGETERMKLELAEAQKNAQALADSSAAAEREAAQARAEADDYVEKARVWADSMIADAQHKADGILDAARKTAAAISPLRPDGSVGGALSEEQLDAIAEISDQLEELSRSQATQIMQLRRKLMTMATDM